MRPAILNAVKRAKEVYGDLDIIVTGHSMGGAMAAFCAFDLIVSDICSLTACKNLFGFAELGSFACFRSNLCVWKNKWSFGFHFHGFCLFLLLFQVHFLSGDPCELELILI